MLTIASCLSNKMINKAYTNWEQGNYIAALDNATSALVADPTLDSAKIFLSNNYQKGIDLSCEKINSYYRLEDPQRSQNVADGYEQLVKINTRMKGFNYPLVTKDNSISFTPSSIIDFSPHLHSAKIDAANAYLYSAKTATNWKSIHEYGKLALQYAPTQQLQNTIKATIPDIFYQKAVAHKAKKNKDDYLIALDGFNYCLQWNSSYKDTQSQIQSTKDAIADIYYSNALAIYETKSTRTELKNAIAQLDEAKKYTNAVKVNNLYDKISESLTIYIYPIFDSKDYEYSLFAQQENHQFPNDIRGIYLSKLQKKLNSTPYVKFDNKNNSFASILHPYILKIEMQGYQEPQFIKSASDAKINYVVKMDICAGEEAKNNKIQIINKDETKSRAIQKEKVIIKYIGADNQLHSTTITPPQSVITSITNSYAPKGEILRLANLHGAKIPTNANNINAARYTSTEYLRYIKRTENYSYPIELHWELIDIATKKIVKNGIETKTMTTPIASYTYKILENSEAYDTQIDGPTKRTQTTPKVNDMIKNSVESLFESLNAKIVPYIKSQL